MRNQTAAFRMSFCLVLGLGVIAGALVLLAGAGCSTVGGPAPASFASVTIQNHSSQEIATATAKVFGAEGYAGSLSNTGELVFQKGASRLTTLSREGLVATHYGSQTVNRVRVEIIPLSGGSYRLQCQAYVVRNAGDSFFEDEVRLSNMRRGSYQLLLNQVAKQLK